RVPCARAAIQSKADRAWRFGTGDSLAESRIPSPQSLLDFDLRADFLELLLDRLRLVLGDAFLDRLGRAPDEVLGFLEAERGALADALDDVDLVGAPFGGRPVDPGLLFDRRRSPTAGARHRAGEHRHRRRRRHAELRLERLHELGELEHADSFDVIDDLLLGHFGHCCSPEIWKEECGIWNAFTNSKFRIPNS